MESVGRSDWSGWKKGDLMFSRQQEKGKLVWHVLVRENPWLLRRAVDEEAYRVSVP